MTLRLAFEQTNLPAAFGAAHCKKQAGILAARKRNSSSLQPCGLRCSGTEGGRGECVTSLVRPVFKVVQQLCSKLVAQQLKPLYTPCTKQRRKKKQFLHIVLCIYYKVQRHSLACIEMRSSPTQPALAASIQSGQAATPPLDAHTIH